MYLMVFSWTDLVWDPCTVVNSSYMYILYALALYIVKNSYMYILIARLYDVLSTINQWVSLHMHTYYCFCLSYWPEDDRSRLNSCFLQSWILHNPLICGYGNWSRIQALGTSEPGYFQLEPAQPFLLPSIGWTLVKLCLSGDDSSEICPFP